MGKMVQVLETDRSELCPQSEMKKDFTCLTNTFQESWDLILGSTLCLQWFEWTELRSAQSEQDSGSHRSAETCSPFQWTQREVQLVSRCRAFNSVIPSVQEAVWSKTALVRSLVPSQSSHSNEKSAWRPGPEHMLKSLQASKPFDVRGITPRSYSTCGPRSLGARASRILQKYNEFTAPWQEKF